MTGTPKDETELTLLSALLKSNMRLQEALKGTPNANSYFKIFFSGRHRKRASVSVSYYVRLRKEEEAKTRSEMNDERQGKCKYNSI
jgi:hypothetical protein